MAKKSKNSVKGQNRTPYAWLGAGALTLGVGAGLTGGSGIAYADSAAQAGSASPATHSASAAPVNRVTAGKGSSIDHATGKKHPTSANVTSATAAAAITTPIGGPPKRQPPRLPVSTSITHTTAGGTSLPSATAAMAPARLTAVAAGPVTSASVSAAAVSTAAVPAAAGPGGPVTGPRTGPGSLWFGPLRLMAGFLTILGVHPQRPTPPGNPIGAWAWGWFRGVQTVLGVAPPKAGTATVGPPDPTTGTVTGSWKAHEQVGLPLTYKITTNPADGTATVAGDGTFTYTPTAMARLKASIGGPTTDAFTVTITDGLAGTYESVSVPISAVPDIPKAPMSVSQASGPNGSVSGTVSSTDPLGLPVTYSLKGSPANGSVAVFAATGEFIYKATSSAQLKASVGGPTTDSFTVTASNGTYTSDVGTITVPIAAVPDVPSAPTSVLQVNGQNGSVFGTVSSTDPLGLQVTYSINGNPVNGTVVVKPAGGFMYTATDLAQLKASVGGPTTDSFTVTASNGVFTSAVGTITVPIAAVPDVPSAPTSLTQAGGPVGSGVVTGTVTSTDPAGSPLTFAKGTGPQYGVVTVTPSGGFTYTATQAAQIASVTGGPTTDSFTVTASNGTYTSTAGTITVTIPAPAPNTVIATIPAGTYASGVAFSPNGSTAYVANEGDNTVSAINTTTHTVTSIPVGNGPLRVAVSPDGTAAYVTDFFGGTVSVINTATHAVTTIPVSVNPTGVVFSPNGNTAYVAGKGTGVLSVINTTTNSVTNIPSGSQPFGVALSPDGNTAYVTNDLSSGTVTVVDLTTKQITATIGVGSFPKGITLSPDGSTAYVANLASSTVSVINTATHVVTTITVGAGPSMVAVSPDGSTAYVTNQNSSTLSVIDTATNTVITTVPVGTNPVGVAFSPNGNIAYVTNVNAGTVSVIYTGL